MVYGIFTAGQRSWGGPRVDAAKAGATTSPQAAIERAEAMGDDLNIVPETFRTAVQSRYFGTGREAPHINLQPSDSLAGRFRSTGSSVWFPAGDVLSPLQRRATVPARMSVDSLVSDLSASHYSIHMPRRAESIFDLENQNAKQSLTSQPGTRSRAHPPSAQSAFYEHRHNVRLSEQSLRSPSRSGTQDSIDLGSISRASLFHENLDADGSTSDIPLLELSRPGSPGLAGHSRGHETSSVRRGRSSLARSFSAQDLETEVVVKSAGED